MTEKVSIRKLPTGVTGLDAVLGGGIPEFSFNVVAGSPGSGKTTLIQQIVFASARLERPALFFTVLGEPLVKMLRYQQQFTFFDLSKVNDHSVQFVNLTREAMEGGLDGVLKRIIEKVEAVSPAFVVVDSFRAVIRTASPQDRALHQFVQKLAMNLTGWQATTFLIGGPLLAHVEDDSVFTVADGVLSLSQSIDRNSMVRKMEIVKMRGQGPIPGLHTFRITDGGIHVFPRIIGGQLENSTGDRSDDTPHESSRLSIGVPGLDEMLGGGIPSGYSILVSGPSGSGKTVLASHFIDEGVRMGERAVVAVFEKRPAEARSKLVGRNVTDGHVTIVHTRPLDLSIDETMYELAEAVHRTQAKRVVIDSLSGFELALAPTFREDFRESLYRMIASLTSTGLTVLLTAELEDRYTDLRFSPHGSAFLTDGIIVQRYGEFDGRLRRIMTVVKLRSSAHSKDIRYYEITDKGLVVGELARGYEGLFRGSPHEVSGEGQLPASSAPR